MLNEREIMKTVKTVYDNSILFLTHDLNRGLGDSSNNFPI